MILHTSAESNCWISARKLRWDYCNGPSI